MTLIERGRIGGEASGASAGIISLPTRPWFSPERIALGQISLERYPALVSELEERTGIGIDYQRPGEWSIAVDETHAEAEDAVAGWQLGMGLHIEEVPVDEARRRISQYAPEWTDLNDSDPGMALVKLFAYMT